MPRPVFLAAPEQGDGALGLIDKLLLEIQVATGGALKGSHFFVPHLQVGDAGVDVDAGAWFSRALTGLQEAHVVVAVLDGAQTDDSVAFLLGYAFAAEKPIIGYQTDRHAKAPLVEGACAVVVHDLRGLSAALAQHLAP